MGRGIIGTVQLAATLAFAFPVAFLGLDFLARGQTLVGAGFLAVAVGMVAIEEYVTTPTDLPGKVAEETVGRVIKEPDDES